MLKIETLKLRVTRPEKQCEFYTEVLGMRNVVNGSASYNPDNEASILFLPSESPYSPEPNDVYWKIALSVPNIELACEQLSNKGVNVGSPAQFQDIGYLAHFKDPEGFTIELIEHYFQGDRPDSSWDHSLLGGGAHLNLITLRTVEIAPIDKKLREFGMTPLSVQSVASANFTLYFYGFTTDTPPASNLHAIENRTWVYQRPFTVLEIQHVPDLSQIRIANSTQAGYAGMQITKSVNSSKLDELLISSHEL